MRKKYRDEFQNAAAVRSCHFLLRVKIITCRNKPFFFLPLQHFLSKTQCQGMMLHELAAIIKGCLLFIKFYCILSIGLVLKNTYRLKVNSLHWQSRIKLVLSHSAKNSSTMWLLIDSISPFWGEAFTVWFHSQSTLRMQPLAVSGASVFFVAGCSQSEPQPVQRVPVTTLADGLLVPQAKFTTMALSVILV